MGVSKETNLPIHWSSTQNVRWKAPLPERGNSTPIVWGDRVFITQAVAKQAQRLLLCFDRGTGKALWQAGTVYPDKELSHETNPHCSASPVTDGERVVASFGSAGLFCYDFNSGKELWHRDLGKQVHIWGNAASPILFDKLCILNFGPGERTFLIAVDKRTGQTLWQVNEPGGRSGENSPAQGKPEWIGSWSTPIVIRVSDHDELVMSFPKRVAAFDPLTGKELWTCSGLNELVYTSPIYADGVVVCMGGYMGSSLAVRPGGRGDVTATHRLWQVPKTPQRIGSGVISGNHIYIVNDPGTAQCLELQTGKVLWTERLKGPGPRGDSWSSMLLAGASLYALNQAGDAFVLKANPQFEVLATNSLGETTMASPAVSNGDIFIRTHQNLWCIGSD